ncbi:hypothetical protein JX266_003416 [Neoarthrinium moseri]|nr:hypothetical protein JX266_003416 [Neoarthrinium moseri]
MTTPRFLSPQTYESLNDRIKAYTDEPVFYENYDVVGAVGHARTADLEIGSAIAKITKSNPKAELVELEFYADRLSCLTVIQPPKTCALMTFVARIALAGSRVKIQITDDMLIMLHCGTVAAPITFEFLIAQKPSVVVSVDPATMPTSHRCWAIQASADGTASVQSIPDSLAVHFNAPSLVDLIKDDGQLASIGHDVYNDNLRRLLDYQLLLASVLQERDPTAAYELARFVLQICDGIAKGLEYYARASALVAYKVVGEGRLISPSVPKLDLSIAQQVLDSRLLAAATFDDAFRDLRSLDANSENVKLFATVALEASVDSEQAYAFIADLAGQRFNAAQEALKKAQSHFQSLQLSFKDRQTAFKDGIESWKTKNILKAVGEGLFAVAAIAGSIAVACVAPPAGAAGIAAGAAGVGKAVEGVAAAAKQIGTMAKIIEVIKNIYSKLKPGLEKVDKLVAALTTIIKLSSSMSAIDEAAEKTIKSMSMPASKGDDSINLTADWDAFQAEMNKLYDSIKEEDINGAAEFFLAITQMVIRGKALLAAQVAVASTGEAYLTVLTQGITQQRHTDRLRKAIPKISGNTSALRLVRLTMAERLLTLRIWITLDFQQYLSAYTWHALDSKRPITVDPMKDLGSFRADAAVLQAAAAQVGGRVRAQTRKFCFTSTGALTAQANPMVLSSDFVESLRQDRSVSFSLDIMNPVFSKYSRVRTTGFRIFLDGAQTDQDTPISLRVVLGREMKDLAPDRVSESDAVDLSVQNAPRILNFVTTESVFGYEYIGSTKEILMDGALSGEHRTSPMSPFRAWNIHVESDADLSAVERITLELTCEVSYLS